MNLSWIASPFVLAVLLAAGMIACIFLFFTLKKEIAESEARYREKHRTLETAAGEMRESLAYLQRALEEAEGQSAASARPIAGMNMTKRGQVLRMYRRGEQPEQIAAALTLPLNEVELLLKVHRSVISQF